jgi:hypothetical protein
MSAILRSIVKKLTRRRSRPVEILLKLMRMGHAIMGITPPPPEHERVFLLGWIVSLVLIIVASIGLVMFLVPRIMR